MVDPTQKEASNMVEATAAVTRRILQLAATILRPLGRIFREILRRQQCLALLGYSRLNAFLRKCAYGNVIGITGFISHWKQR